jgi:hypothetical protein
MKNLPPPLTCGIIALGRLLHPTQADSTFPSTELKPGQIFWTTAAYKFSLK